MSDLNIANQELLNAALSGETDKVIAFSQVGANINIVQWGITPLMATAITGQVDTSKFLLKAGADVNTSGEHGVTALKLACGHGHIETVKLLVGHGADIHAKGKLGDTAIMWASGQKHPRIFKSLWRMLRSSRGKIQYEGSVISEDAVWMYPVIIYFLVQAGANVDEQDALGDTPLCMAAEYGHVKSVDLLLRCGADINNKGEWGATPLIKASMRGQVEVVKLLIFSGADTSIQDNYGRTAWGWAVKKGNTEVADLFD
jgi:ankyrin repeat protein